MEKFEKTIELKSLTSDELFMKNATKSNQMQQIAISIIQEAMKKIMDSTEQENILREVNTDTFILRCNQELMKKDPHFAASKGFDEEMVNGGNNEIAQ